LTENIKSETTGRTPINNQDRFSYYKLGEKYEDKFVEICQAYNIDAQINPEKETNKFAPDLKVKGKTSDLKTQTLPFFKSQQKFNISPLDTITLNRKDVERYKKNIQI
jgi:hypothetical protein